METVSPENLADLETRYRTTVIIFAAQILSAFVLTLVALFLAPKTNDSISPDLLRTLWIVITFIAVGTFILRRFFLRWDRLRDIALLKGIKGLLRTLQTNAIILSVFAETIVIIGLIVTFLSGDKYEILRAGFVALILFAINFPRKKVWEKIVLGLQEI
jgi:hypothetical protein